ncbi:MAG TPA: PKD domain-containing protein [Saprospiraceae bacterium]|mgnify:CR=1 FL=1|nr:PKD domain-containing protein [Saprospiraceae bacterium]
MHNFLLLIFFFFFTFLGHAQKEDHIWMVGDEPYDIILPDRAADTTRGATNLDFNYDPPKIYYDPKRFLDFAGINSSICTADGSILAYTNGQVIYNRFDQPIEDTINYSLDWEYCNLGDKNMAIPSGLLGVQEALMLPVPGTPDLYYTFYTTYAREANKNYNYQISYAKFMVSDDDPGGELISKDNVIMQDSLSGSITAVRHGNGRDWWLITPRRVGNSLNIWLVNPNGIHFHGRMDTGLPANDGIGQIYGSPDGKWLSWFVAHKFSATGAQFFLSKFDRCKGIILNPEFLYVDVSNYRFGFGVSFSHDSKYLYMCNRDFIYQYDLGKADVLASELKVAIYDGYEYYFPYDTIQPLGRPVDFCIMSLAPDGRIYIMSSSASTRMVSVMHSPFNGGVGCDVRQHSLLMPTGIARGLPNFPDYRLGPLDGSPCDTLGMDNHPVAKFRYEADTLDHLRLRFTDLSYFRPETWNWDFGDGSPNSEERYPVHRYDKNGTYEVCLTVSNENSVNTVCRIVNIGGTGTSDGYDFKTDQISLYPNPVSEKLLITLGEYIPEKGMVTILDVTGKTVLSTRLYYGQNTLDLTRLSPGMYFCVMTDGGRLMKTEKVVVE